MELLLKLFWLHYGNTAFGVSSLGIQNWQGFKGQLLSKWFFGVVDFLQKTNKNKSSRGIIVVKSNLFGFFFWRKLMTPKNHFEINWPLVQEFFFEKQIMHLKTMFSPDNRIQDFPCSSCNSRAERFLRSLNRVIYVWTTIRPITTIKLKSRLQALFQELLSRENLFFLRLQN